MTDNGILDPEDDAEASGEGTESPVISELRNRLKAAEKQAKDATKAAQEAADLARAEVKRELTAQELVNALGYPKLANLVVANVEGDLTQEAVAAYLGELGLTAGSGEQNESADDKAGDTSLAEVASLGQRVASAASGQGIGDIQQRLAAAESQEEIAAITREAGIHQSS